MNIINKLLYAFFACAAIYVVFSVHNLISTFGKGGMIIALLSALCSIIYCIFCIISPTRHDNKINQIHIYYIF